MVEGPQASTLPLPAERKGSPYATKAVATSSVNAERDRIAANKRRRSNLRTTASMFVLCLISVLAMTLLMGLAGIAISGGWRIFDITHASALAERAWAALITWAHTK